MCKQIEKGNYIMTKSKTTKKVETKKVDAFVMPSMLEEKQVGINIDKILAQGKVYQKDIHDMAIQCLLHFKEHGNLTLANHLVNEALPSAIRRDALIHWFVAFAPCVYLDNDKFVTKAKRVATTQPSETWKRKLCKDRSATASNFDIKAACQMPFWVLTKQPDVTPLTIDKIEQLVKALSKRIEKNVKEGTFEGEKMEFDAMQTRLDDLLVAA